LEKYFTRQRTILLERKKPYLQVRDKHLEKKIL
jgi:hypothetical protein